MKNAPKQLRRGGLHSNATHKWKPASNYEWAVSFAPQPKHTRLWCHGAAGLAINMSRRVYFSKNAEQAPVSFCGDSASTVADSMRMDSPATEEPLSSVCGREDFATKALLEEMRGREETATAARARAHTNAPASRALILTQRCPPPVPATEYSCARSQACSIASATFTCAHADFSVMYGGMSGGEGSAVPRGSPRCAPG